MASDWEEVTDAKDEGEGAVLGKASPYGLNTLYFLTDYTTLLNKQFIVCISPS